jgi:hypothetical protein
LLRLPLIGKRSGSRTVRHGQCSKSFEDDQQDIARRSPLALTA